MTKEKKSPFCLNTTPWKCTQWWSKAPCILSLGIWKRWVVWSFSTWTECHSFIHL